MITHNLKEIQKRLENVKNNIIANRQKFFEQNKEDIDVAAHNIVEQVVYSPEVYTPVVYKRTRNLFDSVDTQLLEENSGIAVFINPAKVAGKSQNYPSGKGMGLESVEGKSIYPVYVMKGEWEFPPVTPEGQKPRDFLRSQAGWTISFRNTIPPKFHREVLTQAIQDRGV